MIFSFDLIDYGIENDDLYGASVGSSILNAKTNVATKDPAWEKILGSVLKYGKSVVEILVSAGVIKNANLSTLTSASYNKGALDALLAANNGNIADKQPSQIAVPTATQQSRSSLFDFSNPIVIILIIAVFFLLFFKK